MQPGDYKKLTVEAGIRHNYDFIVVELLGKSQLQTDNNGQSLWEVKNMLSNTCYYVQEGELW
jgi:hypothetical protein